MIGRLKDQKMLQFEILMELVHNNRQNIVILCVPLLPIAVDKFVVILCYKYVFVILFPTMTIM